MILDDANFGEVLAWMPLPKHTNPLPGENSKIKPPIRINAIPIPQGATNGDMIKIMFPNQTIGCAIPITDRNGAKFYRTTINGVTDFTEDWWNAPYKKEVEE